jgi:hypothetical protein
MPQVHLIKFRSLPQYFGSYHERSTGTYKTKIIYFSSKRNAKKCAREMNKFYKRNQRVPTLKNMYDMRFSDCDGLCENFIVHTMDKDSVEYSCAMTNLGSMACTINNEGKLSIEDELHIEMCHDVHREYLESLISN